MPPSIRYAALAAALSLASCATEPSPLGHAGPPAPAAASPAPVAPTAATATASSAAPPPSLRDTQRLDRELGSTVVPYPFDHCAVIQRPFDGEPPKHRRIYQGHEVLFCCTPCVRAFDANPDPYMPRIVAAAAARDGQSE